MDDTEQPLYISALQHIAYCPRQFALIHVEQVWAENRFTAEGQLLHQRVDTGQAEQRKRCRYERSTMIRSNCYRISGKMDLLEIELADPPIYRPVEYKRGKPKIEDWDRIQLCAQALCIEEMRDTTVNEGAIWYWEVRRREKVSIDEPLRQTTIATIQQAHQILATSRTPPPTDNIQRCRACSLHDLCAPEIFRRDRSNHYVSGLFET